MAHYIDKDALVAEIERRTDELWALIPDGEKVISDKHTKEDAFNLGKYIALESLDKFIDTLEVEEVDLQKEPISEDLEDALKAKVDEELQDPVFGKLINTFAAYAFAKQIANWQKEQDEKNIGDRLWEAHLKGEIETKEQLMKDVIDATIDIIYTPTTWLPDIVYDTDKLKNLCKDRFEQGDKVKVIIIKD